MADLEGERDTVEKDRRDVMNTIQWAHALAGDCHGDIQTLMEDLQVSMTLIHLILVICVVKSPFLSG